MQLEIRPVLTDICLLSCRCSKANCSARSLFGESDDKAMKALAPPHGFAPSGKATH